MMTAKRSFYYSRWFILWAGLSSSLIAGETPNVLLIIVDDLRPTVGAYGDTRVHTPNIDKLAESGVLFENAYASVPVCGASRASLLSGRKPTTNRFLSYNSRLDVDLPTAISLPQHFKNKGYYTVANGKIFDNYKDSASAWSEPVWRPSGQWTSSKKPDDRGEDMQAAYLNNPEGVRGPAFERLTYDVVDASYPDGKFAEKTVADIKRLAKDAKPFFIALGLRKPHLPFNTPKKYWDLYQASDFSLPRSYRENLRNIPPNPFHSWGELRQYAGIPAEGPLTDAQAINLIHGYHAAVSYADAQIGKVLQTLDEENLSDNTVVVLIGDHGFNLGEHTLWTKHTLFDMALHSPLIIRAPIKARGRYTNPVGFLDIYPTVVDLAGLPQPELLDGLSLLPSLNDMKVATETVAISRWFNGSSLRAGHYRYTEWRTEENVVTARMLFDLANDPDELNNVAEDPKHLELVSRFNRLLTDDKSHSPWAPMTRYVVNQLMNQ